MENSSGKNRVAINFEENTDYPEIKNESPAAPNLLAKLRSLAGTADPDTVAGKFPWRPTLTRVSVSALLIHFDLTGSKASRPYICSQGIQQLELN
jgi:hypothetical protein